MKAIMVVDYVASKEGIRHSEINRALGKSKTYFNATKSRGSTPRCDIIAKMLEVCGWRLVAVPARDVPRSAIILDSFNENA